MSPTLSHPYAPRVGCPLCTIVACSSPGSTPSHPGSTAAGPSSPVPPIWITPNGGEVIYRDEDVTVYVERKDPVSSAGHIVVVFNAHIPSLYSLLPADIPLLQRLLDLCPRLLSYHFTSLAPISPNLPISPTFPSTPTSPNPSSTPSNPAPAPCQIGFITPPFRDPKLPITNHLHLHAYIGARADRVPWLGLRALAFGSLGWYAVDDLIAEIRESTSNNRVKSAYPKARPIASIPDAGTRAGLPDGRELTGTTGAQRLGSQDDAVDGRPP